MNPYQDVEEANVEMESRSNGKKKIVVIVSGGLDSTTLLWYLQSRDHVVQEVLTFDYGQRHRKEIDHSKKVVQRFREVFDHHVGHVVVNLRSIRELIAKGALFGEDDVPHEMYDTETQRVTIVPNRNMIMISIAVGRAVTIGAQYVGYAAHASDYEVYPDCRPEFVEQLDKAIYLGNLWTPVHLIAPFVTRTKAELVKLGNELGVPFELTWSCYEGKERPCLSCGTCLERTEAFLKNDLVDPALSSKEWDSAVKILKEKSQHRGN